MPQSVTLLLHFELNGSPIVYMQEFNFLGLTLDSSLSLKFHLNKTENKIYIQGNRSFAQAEAHFPVIYITHDL